MKRDIRHARAERGQLAIDAAVAVVKDENLRRVRRRARRISDAQAVVADGASEGER